MLTSLEPVRVVEGGRLWVRGDGFPEPDTSSDLVTVGGAPARIAFAASDRVAVVVPSGLEGGDTPVKVAWVPGATLYARVGMLMATGLHQVDNPIFGADGHLYVTYSGTRGQEAAVSIFRVHGDGAREPFVHSLVNPTSMAVTAFGIAACVRTRSARYFWMAARSTVTSTLAMRSTWAKAEVAISPASAVAVRSLEWNIVYLRY